MPSITFSLPNDKLGIDGKGRRYGSYFWLTFKCGHARYNVYPEHVRGFKFSYFWKQIPTNKNILITMRNLKEAYGNSSS